MIGKRLADQLTLRAGDSVTLVAPRGAVTPMGTTPRIKVYKIAAVFEIGMSEYDALRVHAAREAQAYFNRERRDRDRGLYRQSRPLVASASSSRKRPSGRSS
jgi:ABC-type lipoprotein release transport system permease subunit